MAQNSKINYSVILKNNRIVLIMSADNYMFTFNGKFNFKDLDLAFIDTETTGRGFEHEIIEIAVVRANAFNFSIIDEWDVKIKPKHIENAEEASLKINGYNEHDWGDAFTLEDAMKVFLEKTENTILVGHNMVFDWYYIHKALEECNLKSTFWFKCLDTISLAWLALRDKPEIKNLSIRELTRYFDIEQDRPHSALDDAQATRKLFIKITEQSQSF